MKPKSKSRNKGREVEKRVLKKIKARPQPNSGAIPGMPNDGIKGRYLIEVKSTVRGSIGVKKKWLLDLFDASALRNKTPAMILVFVDERVEEWVLIPQWDFEKLTNNWRKG